MRERHSLPVRVGQGSEPWIKARAAMPAVEASAAEIIILADADVWTEGLSEAVRAVQDGAPWAIPHQTVYRLTEAATEAYIASGEIEELAERPRQGVMGGGFVVIPRETLLEIPLDPRFVGWGQEDHAHGIALATLVGAPWRGDADLIHLYHPPASRLDRRWGSIAGRRLFREYVAARRDPDRMRAILDDARTTPKPSMHADRPHVLGRRGCLRQ